MRIYRGDFELRALQARDFYRVLYREDMRSRSSKGDTTTLLKAGAFLVLYNLQESFARLAIQEIHDEIERRRMSFESLLPSIRRQVIKGFKKNANAETHIALTNFAVSAVTTALVVEDHFGGNVDARLLRDTFEIYGVSRSTDYTSTHHGADLLTIKTNRNDLAHGLKTFEEVGRNYSTRDIIRIGVFARAYLRALANNLDEYLDHAGYVLPASPAA